MGKSYISAEEMISVDIFNEITVSDNGKKYAYIKKTADWGKNEYLKELWTVEGRKAVKVCNGAFSVKFSKDGRLSYIRKAGKKNQIFVYDGEEVQITFKENGVSGFYCWNNEDDGFYFLACEENKKIKDRKENFGDYYFEDRDYNYPDLYSVNIKQSVKNNVIISKIPKDLRDEKKLDISEKIYSPGNININSFAVSDNYIYFSGSDSPDINDVENSEIYRLDLKTLLIKNYDISGVNSSLYISPDKKHWLL